MIEAAAAAAAPFAFWLGIVALGVYGLVFIETPQGKSNLAVLFTVGPLLGGWLIHGFTFGRDEAPAVIVILAAYWAVAAVVSTLLWRRWRGVERVRLGGSVGYWNRSRFSGWLAVQSAILAIGALAALLWRDVLR